MRRIIRQGRQRARAYGVGKGRNMEQIKENNIRIGDDISTIIVATILSAASKMSPRYVWISPEEAVKEAKEIISRSKI